MTLPEPTADGQPANDDIWDVGAVVDRLGDIRRGWRTNRAHHGEYGVEGFPSRLRLASLRRRTLVVGCPLCSLERSQAAQRILGIAWQTPPEQDAGLRTSL